MHVIPSILASLALAAHFWRWSQPGLAAVCLLFPLLLIYRKAWTLRVVQIFLVAGAAVWVYTGVRIASERAAAGEPWARAAAIMAGVALFAVASPLALNVLVLRARDAAGTASARASVAAFVMVFVLGAFPQAGLHSPVPMLAERLLTGAGWVEIFLLAAYAAWLVDLLRAARAIGPIRRRVWLVFSVVFFTQAIIGIAGADIMLMTGKLHLPVPAIIIAGPVFRGSGFFMPILFIATIIAAGPVWCSWLCYAGAWDNLAAQAGPRIQPMPKYRESVRIGILALTVLVALGLRLAGASMLTAALAGAAFGLGGVAVMALVSRRRGAMVHCTMYCPIGLVATVAGKINPFRIRIDAGCTQCRACISSCRYGALTLDDIRRRTPGPTCTLCGDCTSTCAGRSIGYRFPGLSPQAAKSVFLVLAVTLHALCLGFARL